MRGKNRRIFIAILVIALLIAGSSSAFAASAEAEYPLPRNFILYSDISAKLSELKAKNPAIMKYEVIGQSYGGRDLYLVTITDASGMNKLDKYSLFMKNAVNNPADAIKVIDSGGDYKIPVFFNCSIHGNELPGTDGGLKLIEKLVTDKGAEVQNILKNCVVLINIIQNPDGRYDGTRENGAGIDLNRDYITQTQPEVQAVVKNVAQKWFPTVMLDLHGFMNSDNILLEPCTIPHNPNYEYDLAIKHALPHAEAVAAAISNATGWDVDIPFKAWEDGWDDYPPIFTPQYFMYLGGIGHTLEVKFPDQTAIETDYAACMASLNYSVKNKAELLKNQFEIFQRGVDGVNVEKDVQFPEAYIIPMNKEQQKDLLEAGKLIKHLLNNGIIVKKADAEFAADGVKYPKGTYIVPMNQGLRGLANTILWKAEDISKSVGAMYDISSYSAPLLNGFDAAAVQKPFEVQATEITSAPELSGTFDAGKGVNYAMPVENNDAYKVANILEREGYNVYRAADKVGPYPAGTFVIPEQSGAAAKLEALAKTNAVTITGVGETKATLLPIELKKIAVVSEDGGAAAAMADLGFDITPVSYHQINSGYNLEANGFNALVVAGKQSFWEDSYDATGMTWSLDSRGKKAVIDFAGKHDYIGIGYAGAMAGKEAGKTNVDFSFTGIEKEKQTAENGIVKIDANSSDPVTFSYGKGETAFAYSPVWFMASVKEMTACAYFAKEELYLAGFWKEPEKAAGSPIILHDNASEYDSVLFGIDPTFRDYNPGTFGLMANAIYYLGYDGK